MGCELYGSNVSVLTYVDGQTMVIKNVIIFRKYTLIYLDHLPNLLSNGWRRGEALYFYNGSINLKIF